MGRQHFYDSLAPFLPLTNWPACKESNTICSCLLLCAGSKWPSRAGATTGDELAPPHGSPQLWVNVLLASTSILYAVPHDFEHEFWRGERVPHVRFRSRVDGALARTFLRFCSIGRVRERHHCHQPRASTPPS